MAPSTKRKVSNPPVAPAASKKARQSATTAADDSTTRTTTPDTSISSTSSTRLKPPSLVHTAGSCSDGEEASIIDSGEEEADASGKGKSKLSARGGRQGKEGEGEKSPFDTIPRSSPLAQRNSFPAASPFTSPRKSSSRSSSLPLPLLHNLFQQLLFLSPSSTSSSSSSPCPPSPSAAIVPIPSLLTCLSLCRSILASHSAYSLSPKEELGLRMTEGRIGLEVMKVWLAAAARVSPSVAAGGTAGSWADRAKGEGRAVESCIAKGILLCQNHPHLSSNSPALLLLQAEVASLLGNRQFSLKSLKRAQAESLSYTIQQQYTLLLALTTHHLSSSPPQTSHALSSLTQIHSLASARSHSTLAIIANLSRLGVLVRESSFREALVLLDSLAEDVGYEPPPSKDPKDKNTAVKKEGEEGEKKEERVRSKLERQMLLHFLCLGSLVLNHLGEGMRCTGMVKVLHSVLDEASEGGEGLGGGAWEIPLPTSSAAQGSTTSQPALVVHFTPPHLTYILACLVTAMSKRDPTGRRPKKGVFAEEGVAQIDNSLDNEITHPPIPSVRSQLSWETEKATLKAELLCETIGTCLIRSDFKAAQSSIDRLIFHTRTATPALFPVFSAHITLLQAHLAQSTGLGSRALTLYRLAHRLARLPAFASPSSSSSSPSAATLATAAKLGEMGLMLGLGRLNEVREECGRVARECWGNGTSGGGSAVGGGKEDVVLKISGGILTSLMETEILKAKRHLKQCLDLASSASDNAARPIILSLTAALFLNTREKQSLVMLQTALTLARSLGKDGSGGNAALGLWLGEKYENSLRRKGENDQADKLVKLNASHRENLRLMTERARALEGPEDSALAVEREPLEL